MDLSNKFLISSSYGLRELSVSEKDYKDFIANGQKSHVSYRCMGR